MKMRAKPRNASRNTSRSAADRRVGAAAGAVVEGCVSAVIVIATPCAVGALHAVQCDARAPASTILRRSPTSFLLPGASCRSRAHVGAPAAERGDLSLTFDQQRLPEDPQHLLAVGERDLADGEAGWLAQQDLRQPFGRHGPHLHGYRHSASGHPDHGWMAIL